MQAPLSLAGLLCDCWWLHKQKWASGRGVQDAARANRPAPTAAVDANRASMLVLPGDGRSALRSSHAAPQRLLHGRHHLAQRVHHAVLNGVCRGMRWEERGVGGRG